MPSPFPIFINAYYRGTDAVTKKTKPYHWSFTIVRDSKDKMITHQLRGMPGAFYYPGAEIDPYDRTSIKKAELEIGTISEDKFNQVEPVLRMIEVVKDKNVSWNCQNWCLEAIEKLKEAAILDRGEDITVEMVRAWLKEDDPLINTE
jgi:hypothetical protein